MRKALLTLLGVMVFTLVTPTDSFSQMPNMQGWHAKYWFYRWRLRNDFMVMGEGPGQSLVAESRNLNRNGYIKWADATIMHGYYLTMLAIEHKILQDKGRWADLKNNERELYYALKAFERLDYVTETFYSSEPGYDDAYRVGDNTLPPDVNGYFFRDDVGPQFINLNPGPNLPKVPTANYYSLMSDRTGIDYGIDLDYNVSDYCGLWNSVNPSDGNSHPDLTDPQFPIVNYKDGHDNHDYYGHGEMSQDQVIRLLLGFFTIVRSIPPIDYEIDKDKDGVIDVTMNFCQEAKRHTTNIIGRMCGQFSGTTLAGVNDNLPLGYPSLQVPTSPVWTIMNPRHREVETGESPFQYMTPMQEIAGMMYTSANDIGIGFNEYATLSYNSVGTTLWNAGWNGYLDWVNAKMALILNVISNSGSGLLPTARFVANKSSERNIDGFYVPLYDYFWDWNPEDNENDVERKNHAYNYANLMLEAAPCVGPHNFGYTTLVPPGHSTADGPFSDHQDPDGIPYYWNVPFVFDNEHARWDDGVGTNSNGYDACDEGWFSGMDYMLLYNLVYANNDGDKPLYHDLINRVVDYDINTDNYTDLMAYSGVGLMIGGFENLTITSNIYGNTPVTLKALDYVQLDAGIYDPNDMPEGITIEVGKITCGNDFTSSNTPYSIDQCQTCGIENQVGGSIAPITDGRDASLPLEMLTMTEFNELEKSKQAAGLNVTNRNEVNIFPNPATDYLQITENGTVNQIVILDQDGGIAKEFAPSNNLYDIRELASGVYTIILTFSNNEKKYFKVVKL